MEDIENNFKKFNQTWTQEINTILVSHDTGDAKNKFLSNYSRLVIFRAWRDYVLAPEVSEGPLKFFTEALNDFLAAHVVAKCGSWRLSLKSLRSALENTMFCIYYNEHPIEYIQWTTGKHKIGFSEMLTYFKKHPSIEPHDESLNVISPIKAEYATLSKAVHGSSALFRMTEPDNTTKIWSYDEAKLGKWGTRERAVIKATNKLLLCIFKEKLQGASFRQIRELMSEFVFTSSNERESIKSTLNISIPKVV